MLHTGVDLHKRSCVLTTVDAGGRVVAHRKVPAERHALQSYFRRLSGSHRATVEATGGWYWLSDVLRDEGVDLQLAHAKFLKAIAYAKVKTDAVDAGILAQLLRADLIPAAHMISPELRELRDLLRARLHLGGKDVSARNSVHRLLEKYNVPSPDELPPIARMQAQLFQEQSQLLKQQMKRIEHEVQPQLLPHDDVQRLLWIPGIGALSALTIFLEVDGIERFPSDRQFFSYCRLVPGSNDSAERRRHKHSKDGNRYLKVVFTTAAIRAIQYYPEIRAFALSKAHQKNRHVARAIVAKEIARIVYHVLRSGEPFNGTFKGTQLSRTKRMEWPRRANPHA